MSWVDFTGTEFLDWLELTSDTLCLGECFKKNPLSGDSKWTSTARIGTVIPEIEVKVIYSKIKFTLKAQWRGLSFHDAFRSRLCCLQRRKKSHIKHSSISATAKSQEWKNVKKLFETDASECSLLFLFPLKANVNTKRQRQQKSGKKTNKKAFQISHPFTFSDCKADSSRVGRRFLFCASNANKPRRLSSTAKFYVYFQDPFGSISSITKTN